MSYSVGRLTLYAILSSIEQDLRNLIVSNISHSSNPIDVLGNELYSRAFERLNKDLMKEDTAPSLEQLLPYIDFTDAYQLINSNKDEIPPITAKYISEITPKLETLVPIRNRVAHSRPLNFDDLAITLDTTELLVDTAEELLIWKDLKATLLQLRNEPSFVLSLEIPTHYLDETNQNHNLPIPDFDETGFIGRSKTVEDLIRYCLGPYPVVTIIGDGGIGKTALALKVAYDILDIEPCPFDAVVWTSSKTSQLTSQEITRIEGAIETSLGMFQSVASHLAGKHAEDSIEEVLSYLREFKILLILDNLETILDDRVRDFLQKLPSGSKILITSRIGLGAFEVPVKLQSLAEREAVELLRAAAKVRGEDGLVRTNNKTLANFCSKMHNNPGYIKWFVAAVQSGRRPEEVLDQPDTFLNFCMSNVYEHLLEDSRKVLKSMLVVPGKHSQAQLAFLNDMNVLDLQHALQQLMTTNFVRMDSKPRGSSFESQYVLSDLPREYLSKIHPPLSNEYKEINKRRRQLVAEGEVYTVTQQSEPYNIYNVRMRSRSDLVVVKYLKQALQLSRKGKLQEAEDYVAQARQLAPEYYEVHRVDAWIKMRRGNITSANEAYEAALELEPQDAPLLYWYAGFLMRHLDDTEAALELLKKAIVIDAKSFEIQLEIARANLYLSQFDEAFDILQSILDGSYNLTTHDQTKVYDLRLQVFQRRADVQMHQKNYPLALKSLERMKIEYESYQPKFVDEIMRSKLNKAIYVAEVCARNLNSGEDVELAHEIIKWLNAESQRDSGLDTSFEPGQILEGVVCELPLGKFFGFINVESVGEHIFFHRNDLYDASHWSDLKIGTKVKFTTNVGNNGPYAVGVRIVER